MGVGAAGEALVEGPVDIVPHARADQHPVLDAEILAEEDPVHARLAEAVDHPLEEGGHPVVEDVDALAFGDEIHEVDLHFAHVAAGGEGPAGHAAELETVVAGSPQVAGRRVVVWIVQVGQDQVVEVGPVFEHGPEDLAPLGEPDHPEPDIAPDIGGVLVLALDPGLGGELVAAARPHEVVAPTAVEMEADAVVALELNIRQDDLAGRHGQISFLRPTVSCALYPPAQPTQCRAVVCVHDK